MWMRRLRNFLLPDERLSLRLVFDNLRNYAICGALLVFGLWLHHIQGQGRLGGLFTLNLFEIRSTEVFVFGLAGLLLVANVAQTWLLVISPILLRLAHAAAPMPARRVPGKPVPQPPRGARTWLRTVLSPAIALAFLGSTVYMALNLFALASSYVMK